MANEEKISDGNNAEKLAQDFLNELTKSPEKKAALDPAAVLSDPDVLAILNAKQKGQKVRVAVGEESQARVVEQAKPGQGSLDDSTDKIVKAFTTIFEPRLAALEKDVAVARGKVDSDIKVTVTEQIAKAKKEHSDFETLRPKMLEINDQLPGMSIEELYTIAKIRGAVSSAPAAIESERPDTHAARPAEIGRQEPVYRGAAGARALIKKALSEVAAEAKS
jgi:hypothetical protein